MSIPAEFHDLFEKRTFAHFATLLPDGLPHVTPVWVDYDPTAEQLLVNSATGRRKVRNLRADSRAGASMLDPDDPYRYVSLWGHADLTREGAVDHINALSRRYFGEEYPHLDSETGDRVLIRVTPERVVTS